MTSANNNKDSNDDKCMNIILDYKSQLKKYN